MNDEDCIGCFEAYKPKRKNNVGMPDMVFPLIWMVCACSSSHMLVLLWCQIDDRAHHTISIWLGLKVWFGYGRVVLIWFGCDMANMEAAVATL